MTRCPVCEEQHERGSRYCSEECEAEATGLDRARIEDE